MLRILRGRTRLLFGVAVAAVLTACSLIVDTNKDQCSSDGDCASGAVCLDGVCALGSAGNEAGGSEASADGPLSDAPLGCTPKMPVSQNDFLNEPCTTAQCIDFDNCARIGLCGDAALPALVDPPDGGI